MNFRSRILSGLFCLTLVTTPSPYLFATTPEELLHQLKNSHTKSSAMEQLWRTGNPAVVKPLFEALKQDIGIDAVSKNKATTTDLRVCSCLGNMFRMRRTPEVEREVAEGVSMLVSYYERRDTPPPIKRSIVSCLGRIGSPGALPLLHKLLNENLRDDTLFMAIGDIGSSKSVPLLKTIIEKHRPHVHRAALKTLSDMHSSAAGMALKELCTATPDSICAKHPDPKVRKRINESLERQEKRRLRKEERETQQRNSTERNK